MAHDADIRHRFPSGYDVITFCDIAALSKQLLRTAYKGLPPGGLVVAVGRYLSDEGTGSTRRPFCRVVIRAGYTVRLITGTKAAFASESRATLQ